MTVMEMNTMKSLQNFYDKASKFSLRDYFAGQALAGLGEYLIQSRDDISNIAKSCYRIADAMLEEREKSICGDR